MSLGIRSEYELPPLMLPYNEGPGACALSIKEGPAKEKDGTVIKATGERDTAKSE